MYRIHQLPFTPTGTHLTISGCALAGHWEVPGQKPRRNYRNACWWGSLSMLTCENEDRSFEKPVSNFHNDMKGYNRSIRNSSYYEVCSLYEFQTHQLTLNDSLLVYVFVATSASEITSSPNYTSGMFVRSPLERIQFVYLQMVQHDPSHNITPTCPIPGVTMNPWSFCKSSLIFSGGCGLRTNCK